jgi:hypothetical protein
MGEVDSICHCFHSLGSLPGNRHSRRGQESDTLLDHASKAGISAQGIPFCVHRKEYQVNVPRGRRHDPVQ